MFKKHQLMLSSNKRTQKTGSKSVVLTTQKKAPSNKSLNRKIKNITNNLIELKYIDIAPTGLVIPNTGLLINQMSFADNVAPFRNDLEISSTSLSMKGFIGTTNPPGITRPTRVRMMVFWDRQPNGANAVLAGDNGLLENNVVTQLIFSPRNYKTIHRYTILHDELLLLTPQVVGNFTPASGITSTVLPVNRMLSYYWKLSRQMKFDGVLKTIADVTTNSLNIAFFSSEAITSNQPTFTGGIRMYYKD